MMGEHPFKGMVFGETSRLAWSGNPRGIWKLWDDFGMAGSDMIGFWDNAELRMPLTKQQITLRLDPEVIGWFKRTGKGYQSRMGAVLRSYVEAKRKRSA